MREAVSLESLSNPAKRKASSSCVEEKPSKAARVDEMGDQASSVGTDSGSNQQPGQSLQNVINNLNGTGPVVKTAPSTSSEDDIEILEAIDCGKTTGKVESILPDRAAYSNQPSETHLIQVPQQAFANHFLQATALSPSFPHLLNAQRLPAALFSAAATAQLTQQATLLQAINNTRMLFTPQNSPSNHSFSTPNASFSTPNTTFFSPQSNSMNNSQSSLGTSSPGSPRCSMVAGKNIVMGPDGKLRKKRGRPVLSEEEKARKRELQKQMAAVFQNLGVTQNDSYNSSTACSPQQSSQVSIAPANPTNTTSPNSNSTSPMKSPSKKVYTSETIMKLPIIRRLLFEQKNRKNGKGFARKFVYTMDYAVTKLSVPNINLITDENLKEALLIRHERMLEKRMLSGMNPEERECYMREKAREEATRRRHEKQEQNRKSEDQKLSNLIPLPEPTPVSICEKIPVKYFCDIAMLTEFLQCFHEVFALNNSKMKKFTTSNILWAVSVGQKGYNFISSLLCTMLPVVLYDTTITHYKELGVPLREIPVSYQTAPELARLCLKHQKLEKEVAEVISEDGEDLVIGEEEDELSEDLLEKLTAVELWDLSPEELVAFLTALTHRCMAADLLAAHVEKMEDLSSKIYKERANLKKERMKEDSEIKQKKKEERRAKKGNKKPPGRPKGYSPKLGMTIADFYQVREQGKDAANLRRDLLAGRQKRKVGQDKLEEEKKEQEMKEMEKAKLLREERYRECEEILMKRRRTLRISPLGLDRYHSRYWLFHCTTPGLYVEKGWLHEHADYCITLSDQSENGSSSTPKTDEEKTLNGCSEVEESLHTPFKGKGRPKAMSYIDIDAPNQTLPPLGENAWYVYKTEAEVNQLLNALSDKGVREHFLKQAILNVRDKISENLKLASTAVVGVKAEKTEIKSENADEEEQKPEENEDEDVFGGDIDCCSQVLDTLKDDICQIEKELIEGHLGPVENFEEWQQELLQVR